MRFLAVRIPPARSNTAPLLLLPFLVCLLLSPAVHVSAYTDAHWSAEFSEASANGSGTGGGDVLGLKPYGDLLVAVGHFSQVGTAQADCIAAWDGVQWVQVGTGFPGDDLPERCCIAMAVYDGALYVAWGIEYQHYISTWNQSSNAWNEYAHEVDGEIYTMEVHEEAGQHYLVVGGEFSSVGGVVATHTARFDGDSWQAMDGLLANARVNDLVVHDGRLIAGGTIASTTGPGSAEVSNIVEWNGDLAVWVELVADGDDLFNDNHAVEQLASYGGSLYASVYRKGVYIMRTDDPGASWGSVLNYWVGDEAAGKLPECHALACASGFLVAGGSYFTEEGCRAAIQVTQGLSFSCLGTRSLEMSGSAAWNPRVWAVAEYQGQIYVGGRFTAAGGNLASNITRWGEPKHACNIAASDIDFGELQLGCGVVRDISVRNVSEHLSSVAPLKLGLDIGVDGVGSEDFLVVAGGGYHLLTPGDEHVVGVAFAPLTPGQKECDLVFGGDCPPVRLSGVCAQEEPVCAIIGQSPLDFGDVYLGSTACRQFFITNSGGGLLEGAVTETCGEFEISAGSGEFSLAAGEMHAVAVGFSPVTEGSKSCAVAIDGCVGVGSVGLVGAALRVGTEDCSVSPMELHLQARVFRHSEGDITVTNVSDESLYIEATLESLYFHLARGTAEFTLEPGDERRLKIVFAPRFRGTYRAHLDFGPGVTCPSVLVVGRAY